MTVANDNDSEDPSLTLRDIARALIACGFAANNYRGKQKPSEFEKREIAGYDTLGRKLMGILDHFDAQAVSMDPFEPGMDDDNGDRELILIDPDEAVLLMEEGGDDEV